MLYTEVEHGELLGWLCNDDLMLVCDQPIVHENIFMDDNQLFALSSPIFPRSRRRHIPILDFNDRKLFPSISNKYSQSNKTTNNIELTNELNSMLACREYVSKRNNLFDRKQFQQAQAAQANEEKKLEEFKRRQQEQNRIERQQRRRQHPSYVSRFDEKRYVPSIRKKQYK